MRRVNLTRSVKCKALKSAYVRREYYCFYLRRGGGSGAHIKHTRIPVWREGGRMDRTFDIGLPRLFGGRAMGEMRYVRGENPERPAH